MGFLIKQQNFVSGSVKYQLFISMHKAQHFHVHPPAVIANRANSVCFVVFYGQHPPAVSSKYDLSQPCKGIVSLVQWLDHPTSKPKVKGSYPTMKVVKAQYLYFLENKIYENSFSNFLIFNKSQKFLSNLFYGVRIFS